MEDTKTVSALVQTAPNAPAEARVMRPASIEELKEQVKTIQQCMKGLMKPDTHFGNGIEQYAGHDFVAIRR